MTTPTQRSSVGDRRRGRSREAASAARSSTSCSAGRRVVDWSLATAESVVRRGRLGGATRPCGRSRGSRPVVAGGATRSESVRAGSPRRCPTRATTRSSSCTTPRARSRTPALFEAVIAAVRAGADGAVPGLAVTDTVKQVRGDHSVFATLDRARPRGGADAAGVPAARALRAAHSERRRGHRRRRPGGSRRRAGGRRRGRGHQPQDHDPRPRGPRGESRDERAGRSGVRRAPFGAEANRPLVLGGVGSGGDTGFEGHSDADVVAHAVDRRAAGRRPASATSAALPRHRSRWKDADSIGCSREAATMVRAAGWQPGNVDCTVVVRGAEARAAAGRDRGPAVVDGRRAGHREGEAGRGSRRNRPARGHRVLRGRHRHERSPMSPAKRGGRKPPPSRSGGGHDARPRRRIVRQPPTAGWAAIRSRDGRPCASCCSPGRRVRELWVATDLDRRRSIDEILELAARDAVPVREVGATRWRPRPAPTRRKECSPRRARCTRSSSTTSRRRATQTAPSPSSSSPTVSPIRAISVRCSAALHARERPGVVLPRHRAVHITPTVAKAAAGAIEHLQMALVGGIPNALARLRELGVWIVGLDMVADRTLFDLATMARGPVARRARSRGQGHLSARAAALRRGRAHPADRPARVAQRRDRRRAGLLRGDAAAHGGLITGAASRAARPSPARTSALPSDHGWTLRACGRSRSPES